MSADLSLEHLILMPETAARRALAGQPVVFRVLAPVGAYAGRGVLRVLRARPSTTTQSTADTTRIELVCGYESYDRLDTADGFSRMVK